MTAVSPFTSIDICLMLGAPQVAAAVCCCAAHMQLAVLLHNSMGRALVAASFLC